MSPMLRVLLCAMVSRVVAPRPSPLLPHLPAAHRPLPADALRLLGAAQEVSVGAVEGGEAADEWFAAMHRRGRIPLRLWRTHAPTNYGLAPKWFSKSSAYLFISNNANRLCEAFTIDTYWVARINRTHMKTFSDDFLTAHVATIIAVLPTDPKKIIGNEKKSGTLVGYCLWERHEITGALILLQNKPFIAASTTQPFRHSSKEDGWSRFTYHPLRNNTDLENLWNASRKIRAGLPFHRMMQALKAYEKNAENYRINVPISKSHEFHRHYIPHGSGQREILGSKMAFFKELVLRRKFTFRLSEGYPVDTQYSTLVYNGESDMAQVLLLSPHRSLLQLRLLTASVAITRSVVLVPRALPLPAWSLPARVFSAQLFCAWGASWAAYALTWCVMARVGLLQGFVVASRAFSSSGAVAQGRVEDTPPRLALAGALLGSAVVLVSAYQSNLFTLIYEPQMYPEIDNIDQLIASGLQLTIPSDIPSEEMTSQLGVLAKDDSPMSINKGSFSIRLRRRDLNIPENINDTEAYFLAEINVNKLRLLGRGTIDSMRVMSETFGFHLHATVVRRNWPWALEMDKMIQRTVEVGLQKIWYYWDRFVEALDGENRGREHKMGFFKALFINEDHKKGEQPPRSFCVTDIVAPLLILCMGSLMATVLFLWEILGERCFKTLFARSTSTCCH